MVAQGESADVAHMSRWNGDELATWWSLVFTSRLLLDRLDTDMRRGHGLTLDELRGSHRTGGKALVRGVCLLVHSIGGCYAYRR